MQKIPGFNGRREERPACLDNNIAILSGYAAFFEGSEPK